MGKERKQAKSQHKRPIKQQANSYTLTGETRASTPTQPTIQATNTFYRWWNTRSTAEQAFWIGFGIINLMLLFYTYYQFNTGNAISPNDNQGIAKLKGNDLATTTPIYPPTFFSDTASTTTSRHESKEKSGDAHPLKSKTVDRTATTNVLTQCGINPDDIAYIPTIEELNAPVTPERFLQKTQIYYRPDMVLTPELTEEIHRGGNLITNLIFKMLVEEPEFAADFSFVFNHPDFKIVMYPMDDMSHGLIGNRRGSYNNGVLKLNLNKADSVEIVSTIRHEVRHARMDFENSIYKNIPGKTNSDFTVPYNLCGVANAELKEKFKRALEDDLKRCNSIELTAKTRATYRETLEFYQPSMFERFLPNWKFNTMRKKIEVGIQTKQYAPVPLFDPHEPLKQDISIYPMYYTAMTDTRGTSGVMLHGYTVPNIRNSLLESFLNEVKLLAGSIVSGYRHLSVDRQDGEWDAFIAGHGEEVTKIFFPNLTKFHKEKRKLVKEIMTELRESKDINPHSSQRFHY